ncbi:hypothetical protein MPTK1_3g15960 [Marchantia polymorpha subsp. ruderalis]|uniref:Uncharacterized protein n=2 Tax=Marchantia polymorpha TaxID=3197 RepID=A0AAF6B1A5_MARPO|nr:hypothetical protein MARPO_0004s0076 [Marchantia polymorpha]BBN05789.1 hypothetical protein Mp_3g15960 [Marchantia polymorpha subsp. ruderalis]|eukprot:PTQ48789.1 hypothetical protein MARPO_0004s0076 [Marchantia polymorpha]
MNFAGKSRPNLLDDQPASRESSGMIDRTAHQRPPLQVRPQGSGAGWRIRSTSMTDLNQFDHLPPENVTECIFCSLDWDKGECQRKLRRSCARDSFRPSSESLTFSCLLRLALHGPSD